MFFPSLKSALILLALILSSLLTIASIVLIVNVIPGMINNEIFKSVRLSNGSKQYDRFVELPFPLTFKVYLFNVENPQDILKGEKPVVKEVGPYVYKEYRQKAIVEIDEEEDTISYTEQQRFEFDEDASGQLSDSDTITIINIPLITVLQEAEKLGQTSALSSCLNDIFPHMDTLFIDVKVKDILFDGLGFCYKHFSLCELRRNIVCKIAESKRNIDVVADGSLRFSLLNYKKKSNDIYTIRRGIKDIETLGQTVLLNNLAYTHFWKHNEPNSPCDDIKGTTSMLFPPLITQNSMFKLFSMDICRSIAIKFSNENLYKTIKGYTFTPENGTFTSDFTNKSEDCFCVEQTLGIDKEKTCFLDGVIDLQPCFGAPVLLSFPHFLWADEKYVQNLKGVTPHEEIHKSFLTLEPDTGTPLQGQIKIQINTVLRPVQHIQETTKLPRVVFPIFWVEENFALSDEYIDELQESYFHKVQTVTIAKWALLGGSLILTLVFVSYFIYNNRRSYSTNK